MVLEHAWEHPAWIMHERVVEHKPKINEKAKNKEVSIQPDRSFLIRVNAPKGRNNEGDTHQCQACVECLQHLRISRVVGLCTNDDIIPGGNNVENTLCQVYKCYERHSCIQRTPTAELT